MSLKFDINMCRICMKTNDGISIYSDNEIIKKLKFCTQLEILKTDDLPKRICNKCVGQLEVAYEFRKQAEYTDKYLRQVITQHKEELNQSALGKQGLYYEMVLEIFRTIIKVEQDDQIEQLTDFESEEVSIVNIPPTLEDDINYKRTEQLTDIVPVYAEIEEANIQKLQETKQISLFKIAKVTSIPKIEFNQTGEITGNKSWSPEDIDSLTDDIQIKIEQGDQMKQPTNVKSEKTSVIIEEGIQYKGSTNKAKIEKIQKKIFTITKVNSILNNEDDQTGKFECIECGAHFTRKTSLKRHSYIHSGERPYKCKICGQRFSQDATLANHSRIHSDDRPYKCKICDRCFTRRDRLINHSRIHSGERPYKCKICDRCFTQRRSLIIHSRIHSGERLFKCKICGQTFNRSKRLKIHMVIHTREKPFTCVVCDARFHRNVTLRRHLLVHSDEQPYKCNLSDQSFTQSKSLVSHISRHTDEKPYTCETCGYSYRYRKSLKWHVLTKHES